MRPDRVSHSNPQPDPPLRDLIRDLNERIDGLAGRLERALPLDNAQAIRPGIEAAGSEYLTVKQTARFAALSESSIRRAIQGRSLPASNRGTGKRPLWRIARSDLIAWMESAKGGDPKVPPRSELKDLVRRHLPVL